MIAAARNKKRRVINRNAAVRKGQQTGANAGNYLAKVGVEGSNPFARSKNSPNPAAQFSVRATLRFPQRMMYARFL